MADTLLQKDFREKDVQRLRNLISKKYGNKTRDQVGFVNLEVERSEGDVWEENNKMWTIKNGLKQTYTKLDEIRNIYRLPLVCPKCNCKMGSRLDKKLFPFHGMCFNCVTVYETELKMSGKYEEYAMNIMKSNANTFIDEAMDFITDMATGVENEFYLEDGERENWVGAGSKNENVEKMIGELNELKDKIQAV